MAPVGMPFPWAPLHPYLRLQAGLHCTAVHHPTAPPYPTPPVRTAARPCVPTTAFAVALFRPHQAGRGRRCQAAHVLCRARARQAGRDAVPQVRSVGRNLQRQSEAHSTTVHGHKMKHERRVILTTQLRRTGHKSPIDGYYFALGCCSMRPHPRQLHPLDAPAPLSDTGVMRSCPDPPPCSCMSRKVLDLGSTASKAHVLKLLANFHLGALMPYSTCRTTCRTPQA